MAEIYCLDMVNGFNVGMYLSIVNKYKPKYNRHIIVGMYAI